MINFQVENNLTPHFNEKILSSWINQVANIHGYNVGDINYLFCKDDYILEVNNQYLNHNYYTDIITFDYTINNLITGDIVLSIDTVKSNSDQLKTPFEKEFLRVIIHGILHLCGFKDKTETEKTKMRELEDEALNLYTTFE